MNLVHAAACVAATAVAGAMALTPTANAATPAIASSEGLEDPNPVRAVEQPAGHKHDIVKVLLAHGVSAKRAAAIAEDDIAGEALLAAAAVPVCVTATYSNPAGPYQNVKVKNDCATSTRVKVLWAFATDSACHKVAAGSSWTDRHLNQTGPDRWDGVASC